jgi:chromosome segregation ATPase
VRHRLAPVLASALVLGVAGAGCADGELRAEVEELRATQTTQLAEERELRSRIDELETEVQTLTSTDEVDPDDDPVAALSASLAELEDQVTALADRTETNEAATESAREAADAAASDLRSTLDQAREASDDLRGEVDQLRTLYETLRDRLDRLQSG